MRHFERLYIAQYCAARWPEGGYQLGYPLGPIPQESIKQLGYDEAARLWRPWRPEVDAVKFFDDGILLIEAKVFKVQEGVRALRDYGDLVPYTEELRPWFTKPITLRLVVPRTTDIFLEQARVRGIQVDVWVSPEIKARIAEYERYTTPEYQREKQLRGPKTGPLGMG